MTTTTVAPDNVEAGLSDDHGVTFDFDLFIDDSEYLRIMRRFVVDGDESSMQVSAFNSSI